MIDREKLDKFIQEFTALTANEEVFDENFDAYVSQWISDFENDFTDEEKENIQSLVDSGGQMFFIVSFLESKMSDEDKQYFSENLKIDSEFKAEIVVDCFKDLELIMKMLNVLEASISNQSDNSNILSKFMKDLDSDTLVKLIGKNSDIIKYMDYEETMSLLERLTQNATQNEDIIYRLLSNIDESKKIEYVTNVWELNPTLKQYMVASISVEGMGIVNLCQCSEEVQQAFIDKMTLPDKINLLQSGINQSATIFNQIIASIDISEIKELISSGQIHNENLLETLSNKLEDELIFNEMKKKIGIPFEKKYDGLEVSLPEEMTIGVELETTGSNLELKFIQFILNKQKENGAIGDWKAHWDSSCGPEVVSPILYPTNESMEELYNMTEFLQNMELTTNDSCGGHIHFGAKYLEIVDGQGRSDNGRPALRNLMHIWQESEEIIYKMSNGEGKSTRPGALERYSEEEASIIGSSIQEVSQDEFQSIVESIQKSRYHGLNLGNLSLDQLESKPKNTVEFRLSNGTIDIEEIRQNIYLYGRLMVVAKGMTLEPEKYESQLEQFNRRDLTEAEKVEAFLSLVFEDEQQRDVYRRRWESVRDNPVYDRAAAETPRFIRGDYSLREEFQPALQETYRPKSIQELGREVIPEMSDVILEDETEQVQEEQLRNRTIVTTQDQTSPDLDDDDSRT